VEKRGGQKVSVVETVEKREKGEKDDLKKKKEVSQEADLGTLACVMYH
jgi:hypothetical protein